MYDHFPISDHAKKMREKLLQFMEDHIYPAEKIYYQQVEEGGRWCVPPIMEELKDYQRMIQHTMSLVVS